MTTVPTPRDKSPDRDAYAHELAVAQLSAEAAAVERLAAAYARLSAARRDAALAEYAIQPVSVGQLRLVVA